MTDNEIRQKALEFRGFIESAQNASLFHGDTLDNFPYGCCGEASDLLAQYLKKYGVDTIYVHYHDCEDSGGHSWLVVKDQRVATPTKHIPGYQGEVLKLIKQYGGINTNEPINHYQYCEEDISEGLIIDITADQFFDFPVYVGYYGDGYKRFEFRFAEDCEGLKDKRECELYQNAINFKRYRD